MTPKNILAKSEKNKKKKEKYLQDYLERRHHFTPMVYSAYVIPIMEALEAHWRLTFHLSFNLKQEYS